LRPTRAGLLTPHHRLLRTLAAGPRRRCCRLRSAVGSGGEGCGPTDRPTDRKCPAALYRAGRRAESFCRDGHTGHVRNNQRPLSLLLLLPLVLPLTVLGPRAAVWTTTTVTRPTSWHYTPFGVVRRSLFRPARGRTENPRRILPGGRTQLVLLHTRCHRGPAGLVEPRAGPSTRRPTGARVIMRSVGHSPGSRGEPFIWKRPVITRLVWGSRPG